MSAHDVVEVSSEEGTVLYPVEMPTNNGGSAPVPSGGSAPVPSGGPTHLPSGGSAPVTRGGSAPVPGGSSANYPSGTSGVYPPSSSGGSAPIPYPAPNLADPDAETLLVDQGFGGSAPNPMAGSSGSALSPHPAPASGGSALVAVQPPPPVLSQEVLEFREWLRGLQENVLDELPPDLPLYKRAQEYIEGQVRTCWIRFLAECRWMRKNPKAEPRFWANMTKMLAHQMYKELFKDIGKMGLLKNKALTKKMGWTGASSHQLPVGLSGQVLDLTDHDSDRSVK